MIGNLLKKRIILASNSPRRKELLRNLNLPFDVLVKDVPEESFPPGLENDEAAAYLAVQKASYYMDLLYKDDIILITADTIVLCEDRIMGKPSGYEEAFNMLKSLSGKVHEVITGVALTTPGKQEIFDSVTKVYFKDLSDEEIDYYITNYKPYDKAGAYGIQEWIGMIGVTRIEGSYFNVVGLPVQKLYSELIIF